MERSRPLRLLFIHAHVADAACEASGTMAVHVDRGDEVHVVICSDGERHHAALFLDAQEAPGRGDLPFWTRRWTRSVRSSVARPDAPWPSSVPASRASWAGRTRNSRRPG